MCLYQLVLQCMYVHTYSYIFIKYACTCIIFLTQLLLHAYGLGGYVTTYTINQSMTKEITGYTQLCTHECRHSLIRTYILTPHLGFFNLYLIVNKYCNNRRPAIIIFQYTTFTPQIKGPVYKYVAHLVVQCIKLILLTWVCATYMYNQSH